MLLALSSNQKLGLALAGAAFVVFALVSAMVIPRYRPSFPAGHMGWFIAACVLFTVGMVATVALVAKETGEAEAAAETHTTATATTPTETAPTETAPTGTEATGGDPAAGKVVFTANCGGCHTLSDAGTTGAVGPNLDEASPSEDKVVERVTNGQGVMPSFAGTLTDRQIADVAAYVSSVAGS